MQNETLHFKSANLAAPAEIEALAHAFSDLLCVALDECDHAITEVIELNSKETEPGICHSHDFLDANAVMAGAFQKVVGRQPDLLASRDLQLWSGAWELAKLRGFNRNQNDESGKSPEFVSYQIAPVRVFPDGSVEFCSSLSEALSYTEGVLQYAVYGRNPDGTVDWIADCDSAEKAAEYLSGILGRAVVAHDDRAEEYSRLDDIHKALELGGVTDYCGQVCGVGSCGAGKTCHLGIDPETHMPPGAQARKLKTLAKDFTALRVIDGRTLRLTVSPCSWMYTGYGLQVEVRMEGGGGNVHFRNKSLPFEIATEEDALHLLDRVKLVPCSNCGRPAFCPQNTDTNRAGKCEQCFTEKLNADFQKAAQQEAKRLKRMDNKRKGEGFTHRVDAWIHPKRGGDDYQIAVYWRGKPSDDDIRTYLVKLSNVTDDFQIVEL